MRNPSQLRTLMLSGAFRPPVLVRIYLVVAAGLALFYLASPLISYLIFWNILPKMSLTLFLIVLLIPIFAVRLLFLISDQLRFASKDLLFSFILLMWISVLQVLWYPTISAKTTQEDVLPILALTLIVPWTLWLGSESLVLLLAQGLHWRRIVGATYLCLICAVGYGIVKGFNMYGFVMLALQKSLSGEFYNYYIPLSDSLAITGLLLMGTVQGNKLYQQLGVYAITAVLLVFTFSRVTLVLFLIVGWSMLWIKSHWERKTWLFLALLVIAGTASFGLSLSTLLDDNPYFKGLYYSLERIRSILEGTDASFQLRLELVAENMNLIGRNWLLGAFMSEITEGRGKGTYIHNWLSFWISYGIGPFLLSLWCILVLLIKCWYMRRRSSLSLVAFSLLLFGFLSIITARAYVWPYIWFALGFAGAALRGRVSLQRR